MTTKKQRQRGSRTHGHGSSKNNRGAGHRGGTGRAGRSKHKQQNYGDLGKHGFGRRDRLRLDTLEVDIREIDETLFDIELGVMDIDDVDGIEVNQTGSKETQYHVFLSDFSSNYEEYDEVKLLNGGQIHHTFSVFTDTCSTDAKHHVRSVGGNVYLKPGGRGFSNASEIERIVSRRKYKYINNKESDDSMENTTQYWEKVQSGKPLEFHEFDDLMEIEDSEQVYRIITKHFENVEELDGPSALNLMRARSYAEEFGFDPSEFHGRLDSYFEGLEADEDEIELLRTGLNENLTVEDVLSGMNKLYENISAEEYDEKGAQDELISGEERMYLFSVDGGSEAESLLETG